MILLYQMQHLDQQQPCKTVVCNDGRWGADRRDQRTGHNRRVDFDLLEKQWDYLYGVTTKRRKNTIARKSPFIKLAPQSGAD